MVNLYAVLEVSSQASTQEIKTAFRRKAKRLHPDTSAGDTEAARKLIDAYKILVDPQKRREYDRKNFFVPHQDVQSSFDYRQWLLERQENHEYKAKLILYDLLHGLEDEAIQVYERLCVDPDGRLERYFERVVAMDTEFCLAEEYVSRQRYVDAYRILRRLIQMERSKSGFGYFYSYVLEVFRKLVLDLLFSVLTEEAYLEVLDEAIGLEVSDDIAAVFYQRKAELFRATGQFFWADRFWQQALSLDPSLAKKKTRRHKSPRPEHSEK